MKWTYKTQMMIAVAIIILANVLSTVLKHWIYRSAGFVVCGLLWIVHPVLPSGAEVSKRTMLWVRIAGIILILIGIFTRVYTYKHNTFKFFKGEMNHMKRLTKIVLGTCLIISMVISYIVGSQMKEHEMRRNRS